LATLSALAAAATLKPIEAFAQQGALVGGGGKWDLSWMDGLKGKHKQVFDIGGLDIALLVVTNNLDAYREVFDLGYPDVNEVVAIAGSGFPINAGDALWAKYELGRRYKVKEPGTDNWATRNIWLNGTPVRNKVVGVKLLQERGVIFWQCNNALNGVTAMLAADTKQPVDVVKAELVAGLNPGVHIVPAHTQAIGLVQQRGCAYEFVSG
jgi:intracellular sulfur oxidation DsrE/DsrF family protein